MGQVDNNRSSLQTFMSTEYFGNNFRKFSALPNPVHGIRGILEMVKDAKRQRNFTRE